MLPIRIAISSLGLLLTAQNAFACSPSPDRAKMTRADLFANSSAVFSAHVTKVEETSRQNMYKNQIGEITATFVPVEIFKGNLPADKKVKSWAFGPGNCTIPILAGVDYVFFIDPKEQGFITSLDGSFMAFTLESGEVKNALDEMRKYKK